MAVQVRWVVMQATSRRPFPWPVVSKVEGFTKLNPATRRAEEIASDDHFENDYVVIWDLALDKVVWGPQ